jgi:hypothetical protein
VIDGTDEDADARFDWMDVNEDGDLDDWVSIDEEIAVLAERVSDDRLADLVDQVGAGTISVFMLPCYSGGFIDDLSAPNRVISTAADELSSSYGNVFADLFTEAFHRFTRYGTPVDADADGSGQVSMLEAFNYAAGNDYMNEIPQYDDNGDRISHPYPIPSGGDGYFGAAVYFQQPAWTGQVGVDIRPKNTMNRIDLRGRSSVVVAVVSAPGFDAPAQVELASLTFGRSGDENSLLFKTPGRVPVCGTEDVNFDGLPDLLCSFSILRAGFACGDTQGILKGRTTAGLGFSGQDRVEVLPCIDVLGVSVNSQR